MNYEEVFIIEKIPYEDSKTGKEKTKIVYKPKYKNNNKKIYAPLSKEKDKWLDAKPEEKVRQEFICKLIYEYGYSLEQMEQEISLTNSQRGTGRASADLIIWKTKDEKAKKRTAFLVLEFKAPTIKLKVEDCYQGYNYATWSRAKLFAVTNGEELQVFKTIEEELPLKLQPVNDVPNAKDILDKKKLEEALSKTKEFTGDEFAKLLHKCHNIIRNNDKLSPEASFDEISKILFIKIMYEKNPKQERIFSLKQFERLKEAWNLSRGKSEKESSYMQRLFEDVKDEFEDDNIFDQNEKIKLRERSFEQIVKELEIYNLTSTSSDVKGIAFEKFLGRTFRGELGQFFTPRVIVDFIVELLDPQENELICDPCAGSGGFLIKAFEFIAKDINNEFIRLKKEKQKEIFGEFKLKSEDEEKALSKEELKKYNLEKENFAEKLEDKKLQEKYKVFEDEMNMLEKEKIDKLSHKSIFGTDANPRMARVSKMNMIMHGDGHNGIHHNDGLLNINGIYHDKFDVIITNPPFGTNLDKKFPIIEQESKYLLDTTINGFVRKSMEDLYYRANGQDKFDESNSTHFEIAKKQYQEEMKQVTDHFGESIREQFKVGVEYGSGASEVLFIERCLNLLKPGGRMGIVLPEGVLNSSNLQNAREYFESRAKILLIVSLPQDIFISSGATVKTSLVFLKKFTEDEEKEYKSIEIEVKEGIESKYALEIEEIKEPVWQIDIDIENVQNNITELNKDKKKNKDKLLTQKEYLQSLRGQKRELVKEEKIKFKIFNAKVQDEIKGIIREKFDYQIPISDIKKAGISTTGTKIDNELPELLKLFTGYRKENNIWDEK